MLSSNFRNKLKIEKLEKEVAKVSDNTTFKGRKIYLKIKIF